MCSWRCVPVSLMLLDQSRNHHFIRENMRFLHAEASFLRESSRFSHSRAYLGVQWGSVWLLFGVLVFENKRFLCAEASFYVKARGFRTVGPSGAPLGFCLDAVCSLLALPPSISPSPQAHGWLPAPGSPSEQGSTAFFFWSLYTGQLSIGTMERSRKI